MSMELLAGQPLVFLLSTVITALIQLSGFAVAFALQTEIFYDVLGGLNFMALAAFSAYQAEVPGKAQAKMSAGHGAEAPAVRITHGRHGLPTHARLRRRSFLCALGGGCSSSLPGGHTSARATRASTA
jgi:hypothetical protein